MNTPTPSTHNHTHTQKTEKKTLQQPPMLQRLQRHLAELHLYIQRNIHSKQLHHIPRWVWECPPVSRVAPGVGEPLTSCCLRAWLQFNANLEPLTPSPRLSPLSLGYSPFWLACIINRSHHQRKSKADNMQQTAMSTPVPSCRISKTA